MKTAQFQVIVGFFLAVSVIVTYKVISTGLVDPALKQARIAYEIEKIQVEREQLSRYNALEIEQFRVKRANIRRYEELHFYGIVGFFSICGVALIILAIGHSRAKVTQSSVHVARIGQHSEIPIHQKDLQNFYPIAVNLSLAEIEASVSTAHDKAYQISRQMLADITDYTRTLAGKRGMLAGESSPSELTLLDAPILPVTPTFADLLRTGTIASGKPLVLGYDRQGQPQCRSLQDLKSVAIAGWQGSGKTLSTAYLVASSILAYGVQAYVIDPHKQHPESLSALLKPLEAPGSVTIINPFDTPALLEDLNRTLDRRLAGEEANEPGILLVIDELARLAKMDCFDVLVAFLERCTEETRKANITFIGGSHKWTARHFKGRADIRGCMNSMLIHKTKPSQADLLLEDAHDKNLVKHIQRPGEAILVTDYAPPVLVSMPFCTRKDMETAAGIVNPGIQNSPEVQSSLYTFTERTASTTKSKTSEICSTGGGRDPHELSLNKPDRPQPGDDGSDLSTPSSEFSTSTTAIGGNWTSSEVIPLERHRKDSTAIRQPVFDPKQLTREIIRAQLQRRKAQDASLTQAAVAKQAGMSQSYLSRLLNDQCPLSDKHKQKLYEVLFVSDGGKKPERSWSSFRPWRLLSTA